MISLDEIFDLPRPGWGRRRAIARQLLEVVALTAFLIGTVAVFSVYGLVLAP